jgi:DNA gyrase subunit A
MAKLKPIIEQSMKQYAGAVLQSRALVDVRDGLKPSARQIFYCMDKYKYTADKPYQKTMAAIGDAMKHFYIHGDSSCEGIIMRAGQGFAMRYPLVTVKGNGGTLIESGNWAAPRYTEARLSKLAGALFNDIEKDTIAEWRDNYSETEQYPMVLPSKGFYNIVNGSTGIGIGMACSIPQYNITEVNNALIHLIDNPDCDFEEIYCAPDFATGAILYNEAEVKESMRNGQGFACKLRSVVEFDSKERCFVVTEIPYSVYTNTICGELEEIVMDEENPGIERFNDLTGSTPLIKIYLTKKANPDKVLRYLYKNTSLQYYYGINFTMLDHGRFPKVFTWKEMLQAHIDHEKEVYRRGFEFDLKKIEKRIHIIDGLLICLASIEEVVQTIKASASTAAASLALQKNFLLDEEQAKAVLDMKLSRLAHLEVQKLENEKVSLQTEAARIQHILNDEQLFNEEIKSGWRATIKAYGDERRTKILNLTSESDEPIEIKKIQVSLTNFNNVFTTETSTLYTQKRGGVGNKIKLDNGEYIIDSRALDSNEELLFFTQEGNVYHKSASALVVGEKTSLFTYLALKDWEHICAFTTSTKAPTEKYIIFITKKGMIKKSEISEYNTNRNVSLRAITLTAGDEIAEVLFTNDDQVGILTECGNFLMITTADIRAIGRVAQGVHAIKLNEGDSVSAAHVISASTKFIASISGAGLFKKTPINEFTTQTKNTKGSKLQKLNEGDWMADFIPLTSDGEILIASSRSCIKLTTNDIPVFSKGALGNKSIKLNATDNVTRILKY